MRWYRGTPVVLNMDEACFCFENLEDSLETKWHP